MRRNILDAENNPRYLYAHRNGMGWTPMLKIDHETGRPWNPGADQADPFVRAYARMLHITTEEFERQAGRRSPAETLSLESPPCQRWAPRRAQSFRSRMERRVIRIRAFCDRNATLLQFALAPLKAAALLTWLAVFWFFWTGTPA